MAGAPLPALTLFQLVAGAGEETGLARGSLTWSDSPQAAAMEAAQVQGRPGLHLVGGPPGGELKGGRDQWERRGVRKAGEGGSSWRGAAGRSVSWGCPKQDPGSTGGSQHLVTAPRLRFLFSLVTWPQLSRLWLSLPGSRQRRLHREGRVVRPPRPSPSLHSQEVETQLGRSFCKPLPKHFALLPFKWAFSATG